MHVVVYVHILSWTECVHTRIFITFVVMLRTMRGDAGWYKKFWNESMETENAQCLIQNNNKLRSRVVVCNRLVLSLTARNAQWFDNDAARVLLPLPPASPPPLDFCPPCVYRVVYVVLPRETSATRVHLGTRTCTSHVEDLSNATHYRVVLCCTIHRCGARVLVCSAIPDSSFSNVNWFIFDI